MRKTIFAGAAFAGATLFGALGAGSALADEDCRTTMSEWQPREAAVDMAKGFGWDVRRVKVNDGCYELKGRDADGNEVEATLDPGTLALVKFEVEFRPGANPSRYITGARTMVSPPAQSETPPPNGLFSNGAKPSVVVE